MATPTTSPGSSNFFLNALQFDGTYWGYDFYDDPFGAVEITYYFWPWPIIVISVGKPL